ncbi:MAG: glycosyltransferase [Breznakia sp.]
MKDDRGVILKVSVALCTYNGEKYIKKQLLSILQQTRAVDEIIICDDGSNDRTLTICAKILSDTNVFYKVKHNEKTMGVMRNFQQCFSLCSGDIIFSCDQDDVWEIHKVEIMMKHFQQQAHISLIASDAMLMDEKDDEMKLSLRESLRFHIDQEHLMLDNLLRTYCITGATMAFRKTFYEQYFYLSNDWLHDGWLAMMAVMQDGLLFLSEKLTRYRLHGNNACGVGEIKLLMHGTQKQLHRANEIDVMKTALCKPFYFEDFAKMRMNMYNEVKHQLLKKRCEIHHDYLRKLNDCILFWEKRSALRHMRYKECCDMIRYFKKVKAYERYSKSKKLARFDYYFWFVYRCIPRKKRIR